MYILLYVRLSLIIIVYTHFELVLNMLLLDSDELTNPLDGQRKFVFQAFLDSYTHVCTIIIQYDCTTKIGCQIYVKYFGVFICQPTTLLANNRNFVQKCGEITS